MAEKDILIGPLKGISTANRYIKIENQSTGTLTGDNVDSKLNKADRLLTFSEKMIRPINSESVNDLLSAGAINASLLYFEIYEIPLSIYIENTFADNETIEKITIYTSKVINKKITVTDETEYQNCLVAGWERSISESFSAEEEETKPITFKFWIRALQRKRNYTSVDQKGTVGGNLPSLINFPQGTLQAGGGGGGGGGDGGGGGGGGGGGDGGGGF